MAGNSSTMPVASRSLRAATCGPSPSVTSKWVAQRIASMTATVRTSTLSYRPSCSRPSRKSSSGAMPSRVRNPWRACEAALRCCPVSQTSTCRRHRPRMSAALSPAGPAPTMITSNRNRSSLWRAPCIVSFSSLVMSSALVETVSALIPVLTPRVSEPSGQQEQRTACHDCKQDEEDDGFYGPQRTQHRDTARSRYRQGGGAGRGHEPLDALNHLLVRSFQVVGHPKGRGRSAIRRLQPDLGQGRSQGQRAVRHCDGQLIAGQLLLLLKQVR